MQKVNILSFDDSESHDEDILKKTHLVNGLSGDFTVCGVAYVGEEFSFEFTDKKITCPDCIKVIQYYKSIKSTEYKLVK